LLPLQDDLFIVAELTLHMASRSCVNNLTAEDGRMVHSVWGANYERLVTVKRRYDPGSIFRLNHNIDPSG
jgi:hypothetical protein